MSEEKGAKRKSHGQGSRGSGAAEGGAEPGDGGVLGEDGWRRYAIGDLSGRVAAQGQQWEVHGKVIRRELRSISTKRGPTQLLNLELLDGSSMIRASAFGEMADDLGARIQAGLWYRVRNADVRIVDRNKFFNRGYRHEVELALGPEAQVDQVPEEELGAAGQAAQYALSTLRDLAAAPADQVVDLVAVVTRVDEESQIVSKRSGQPFARRSVLLEDDTGCSIELTLWGAEASAFRCAPGSLVACRGAQVGSFGGRSLSLLRSGSLEAEPAFPQAQRVRAWWLRARQDPARAVEELTRPVAPRQRQLVYELPRLGRVGAPAEYATVRAHVTDIQFELKRPPWYQACAMKVQNARSGKVQECNKKVVAIEGSGQYSCVSCGPVPNFVNRYILTCKLADGTGAVLATAFNDVGEKLLGTSADELGALLEQNEPAAVRRVIERAVYSEWILRVRVDAKEASGPRDAEAKAASAYGAPEPDEGAQSVSRRFSIFSAEPVSWPEELRRLRAEHATPPLAARP
jgi:replication factor A1